MGSCFVTTLLLEVIFKSEEQPIGRYIFAHFLVIMVLIFKYLYLLMIAQKDIWLIMII